MGHGASLTLKGLFAKVTCAMMDSLMASKAISFKEGGLVLGFAITVTYFDEMFQKCCLLITKP